MLNFEKTLQQNSDRIEKLLQAVTNKFANNKVNEAIAYSLLSGGKRLRPALVYETAKLFGVDDENIDRLAMAIEMIHTYSLIHDDLPCMDDDDFRRGKPSCHKQFGEAVAVLAGDGLLNLAAEILLGGNYSKNYFDAIKFVFECSGIHGMVGGQAVDISTDKPNDFETLDFLTENKTSKLIMACMGSVGIYCNTSQTQQEGLLCFADNFGKAFQAADDLLDANQDENLSYVNLLGLEETKVKIQELSLLALSGLQGFCNTEFFKLLCQFNLSRQK